MRDLEAERLAEGRRLDTLAAKQEADAKTRKWIFRISLLPFLALGGLLWHEAIFMDGYAQGWTAAKVGLTFANGLSK